jgi:hypothetical protein
MSKTYDANFEEWYKRLFNKKFDKNTDSLTKTENMSDEEFEVGTNLYNAYLQKNNLLDQYNKAQSSLEQEKTQSQQQASIQLDKLKKYIPTQIKAQGLGGLGVSESTLLKANSDYQNKMGQIASDIGARQLDLLQSYNTGVLDVDANLANANQATLTKYQEIARQQEEIARQEREQQKALVDNFYRNEMLLNPDYLTEDGSKLTEDGKNKMKEYLDSNKEILGDMYDTYMKELEAREVYTNEQKTADEAEVKQTETDTLIKEGKEYFNYGGSTYKVKKQLDSKSNEIAHNKDFIKKLNNLGYADAYNPNIPNGTTIEIKCDSSGANEFSYEDLGLVNVADWRNWIPFYNLYNWANNIGNFETRYVTYYDGQWYLSEKK